MVEHDARRAGTAQDCVAAVGIRRDRTRRLARAYRSHRMARQREAVVAVADSVAALAEWPERVQEFVGAVDATFEIDDVDLVSTQQRDAKANHVDVETQI